MRVCACVFVCVFMPVVYVCANSPALFIIVSPVMAAKLTMCFRGGSDALLDKSAAGRRWVLSTPIHLSRDLFPGEGSSR